MTGRSLALLMLVYVLSFLYQITAKQQTNGRAKRRFYMWTNGHSCVWQSALLDFFHWNWTGSIAVEQPSILSAGHSGTDSHSVGFSPHFFFRLSNSLLIFLVLPPPHPVPPRLLRPAVCWSVCFFFMWLFCQRECMRVRSKPECEGSERSLPRTAWQSGCQTCWHCSPGPHYRPQYAS